MIGVFFMLRIASQLKQVRWIKTHPMEPAAHIEVPANKKGSCKAQPFIIIKDLPVLFAGLLQLNQVQRRTCSKPSDLLLVVGVIGFDHILAPISVHKFKVQWFSLGKFR